MTFLSNMRISTKILFLLGLLMALSASISGFAAYNISGLARGEQTLVNGDAASLKWAASAQEHLTSAHQIVFQINSTEFSASGELRSSLLEEEDGLRSDMDHFRAIMTPDEAPLYRTIMSRSDRYMKIAADDIRLLQSTGRAPAQALLLSSGIQAFDQADANFDEMVGKQVLDLNADAATAARQAHATLWLMVLGAAVGGACVGALALFVARKEISGPLSRITAAMAALAGGYDAEPLAPTDRRDEIGDLSRGFTVFRQNAIALVASQREAEEQRKLLEIERLNGGFFRSAIESSLDSVRVLDLEGRLMFMNRGGMAAFEIEDFTPLAGQLCKSLWPEPAATEIGFGVEAASRGATHRFEGMCPTAGGQEKWWDVFIAPVHDGAGNLSAIMATSRDITVAHNLRVEAEQRTLELARTAAALRSAFRVAQVGAWEMDFVTRQATFSDELCDLLQISSGATLPLADTVSIWVEEDQAKFEAALAYVEGGGERLTFEGRTCEPGASPRWWRLFGEPVIENGRCVAIRGAAQEVTGWRELQARERSALEAADAMSTFLANMSHELRTPLNGVLGMAQAMARDELSQPQRTRLTVIEGSGEALLSLLNDLLDVSKIESGKTVLEDGVIDMQTLGDGVRSIFTALARDKDLALRLTVNPGAMGHWRGDPTRVRQVLNNLISNAVKFTDHGSVAVDVLREDEHLVFRVEDTGMGIAPDKLDSIFDRFVQADAAMTRRHGGSGLGLTICRELVSLMDGDIRVESIEGAGTTFVVRLPLIRAETARSQDLPVEAPVVPETTCGDLRVLAAEDNATNQMVLKTLLEQVGIEPTLVWNGQEALDACRAGAWDIILMDIQMPVMDGLTAVRAIREAERKQSLRRTPVIAVTANAMSYHIDEYLAAGMDAVVAKPVNFAALLEAMDAAITAVETDHPQAQLA